VRDFGKEGAPCGDVPARRGPRLVDRGQEATGCAIEREPCVLPGRALTESRQPLHIAPDGTWIRLMLLGQGVRLRGLLLRHVESLHDRIEYRVARRTELLGGGPQEEGAIGGRVRVEGCANGIERCPWRQLRGLAVRPRSRPRLATDDRLSVGTIDS
jgi:hypothetical protein